MRKFLGTTNDYPIEHDIYVQNKNMMIHISTIYAKNKKRITMFPCMATNIGITNTTLCRNPHYRDGPI